MAQARQPPGNRAVRTAHGCAAPGGRHSQKREVVKVAYMKPTVEPLFGTDLTTEADPQAVILVVIAAPTIWVTVGSAVVMVETAA